MEEDETPEEDNDEDDDDDDDDDDEEEGEDWNQVTDAIQKLSTVKCRNLDVQKPEKCQNPDAFLVSPNTKIRISWSVLFININTIYI